MVMRAGFGRSRQGLRLRKPVGVKVKWMGGAEGVMMRGVVVQWMGVTEGVKRDRVKVEGEGAVK